MEVSALTHRGPALRGPTPFLRLQGDERLVALTRRGNQAAYEALVGRYQARLLAFCRHMLNSREDAEDVLQEVFAAAFSAMVADTRPLNVRPWLYRIARNRCLNHLRRQQSIGVDSMDVMIADHGTTTADRVHQREDFRQLIGDVQQLPETQRTALLLREIDALSYDQIAEAMETTVPSVKSLLVRARVSLAEAAEARALSCEEVREELGEVAEGLARRSPPVRRHLRQCDRCASFDKQLRQTNRALAAVFPLGPLLLLKKFALAQGLGSSAGAAAGAGAAGAGAVGAGSAMTAGIGVIATKAAAGIAAAAIVTAGAVEVDHARKQQRVHRQLASIKAAPAVVAAPRVVATVPQPVSAHAAATHRAVSPPRAHLSARRHGDLPAEPSRATTISQPAAPPDPALGAATPAAVVAPAQTESDTTALPAPAPVTVTDSAAPPPPETATAPAPLATPQPVSEPEPALVPEPAPEPDPQPAPDPTAQIAPPPTALVDPVPAPAGP